MIYMYRSYIMFLSLMVGLVVESGVLGAVLTVSKGPNLCGLVSRTGGVLVIRAIDTSGGEIPICTDSGMVSLNSVTVCASTRRMTLNRILRSMGGGRGNGIASLSCGGTSTRRLRTFVTRMLPGCSHSHMRADSVGGLVR